MRPSHDSELERNNRALPVARHLVPARLPPMTRRVSGTAVEPPARVLIVVREIPRLTGVEQFPAKATPDIAASDKPLPPTPLRTMPLAVPAPLNPVSTTPLVFALTRPHSNRPSCLSSRRSASIQAHRSSGGNIRQCGSPSNGHRKKADVQGFCAVRRTGSRRRDGSAVPVRPDRPRRTASSTATPSLPSRTWIGVASPGPAPRLDAQGVEHVVDSTGLCVVQPPALPWSEPAVGDLGLGAVGGWQPVERRARGCCVISSHTMCSSMSACRWYL